MLRISVDSRSIQNLDKLSKFVDSFPAKIKMANSRAGARSVKLIEDNLARRGKPGTVIAVTYERYGEYGMKLHIRTGRLRGGYTGDRGSTGRYSLLIASKIFLNSESGEIGRRAFTLPKKTPTEDTGSRYKISHTSGQWIKGQKLMGPLSIPQLGPFHFSAKNGMPRETISKMSRRVLSSHLNKYYSNALRRNEIL